MKSKLFQLRNMSAPVASMYIFERKCMNRVVKKYNQPGKWEVKIPFEQEGEEKEWLAIIDARASGVYELCVTGDHRAINTKGRISVRAVVGEGAEVKIKGVISIQKGAMGSDEYLELRALTLHQTAKVTLDPELEIEANMVSAGHGASSGVIDREQILYLMSRGLSEVEAREEIVKGWLGV